MPTPAENEVVIKVHYASAVSRPAAIDPTHPHPMSCPRFSRIQIRCNSPGDCHRYMSSTPPVSLPPACCPTYVDNAVSSG